MRKIIYYLFEHRFFDCDCDCNPWIPARIAIPDIAFQLLKSFASGLFWFCMGFLLMWEVCKALLESVGY